MCKNTPFKIVILNLKKLTIFTVFVMFFSIQIVAINSHKHSHSNATGSIIIEKNTLAVHLSLPSESIIGFEGAPKTQQEKNRIDQATRQLKDENLFQFYTKKSWLKTKQQIKLSLDKKSIDFVSLEKNKLKDDKNEHHHHNHKKDEEEHSDIIIKAYYTLQEPTSIKQLETRLFVLFPNLETLELSYIQNNNQEHIKLSKKKPAQALSSY